jgi:ParB family chromosome partitioning protein
MTRKDLLKALMSEAPAAKPAADIAPALPRRTRPGGTIGAVSASIAELRAAPVIEVDPALVDAGGLPDRLEADEAAHKDLCRSIARHGQQVPILVRPNPEAPGRYQIVYGRRRLRALAELGLPARALVRDLDDPALVMAQGQENSARRDLSFAEKCHFAHQMRTAGFDRAAICEAHSIDKTLLSRMLQVIDTVTPDLLQTIGPAHGIGRDRWLALAAGLKDGGTPSDALRAAVLQAGPDLPSRDRFETAQDALCPPQPERLA